MVSMEKMAAGGPAASRKEYFRNGHRQCGIWGERRYEPAGKRVWTIYKRSLQPILWLGCSCLIAALSAYNIVPWKLW